MVLDNFGQRNRERAVVYAVKKESRKWNFYMDKESLVIVVTVDWRTYSLFLHVNCKIVLHSECDYGSASGHLESASRGYRHFRRSCPVLTEWKCIRD